MKHIVTLVCVSIPAFCLGQFVPDGPDAPDVDIVWNNGYTFILSDPIGSNNEGQLYQEFTQRSMALPRIHSGASRATSSSR